MIAQIKAFFGTIRLWAYVAAGGVMAFLYFLAEHRKAQRDAARRKAAQSEANREQETAIRNAQADERLRNTEVERAEQERRDKGERPKQWGDKRL